MRESRRDAARARTDAAAAASTVQRLAVLLEAGISPDRAWQLLAVADDGVAAGSVAADIMAAAAGAGTGRRVGAVLAERGGAWRDV
ncbi:MAG TPA: pilus assembly protein TadB, partial [Microbacterium sp.]|nr:pilus assembly protein TadB [Microbacterium sp.]